MQDHNQDKVLLVDIDGVEYELPPAVPGSPDADDFRVPMQRKVIPETLLRKHPAFFTVVMSAIFITLISMFDWANATSSFAVSYNELFRQARFDKLFLSVFSHGDGAHLAANMLGFVGFGYLLKRHFGLLAFPILPFLAGLSTAALTLLTMPANTGLIGASGIVFAMVGLYTTLYFNLETRHSFMKKLLHVGGFLLVLFVPNEYSPTTSYMAHGIGFLNGVVFAFIALPYVNKMEKPKLLNARAAKLQPCYQSASGRASSAPCASSSFKRQNGPF